MPQTRMHFEPVGGFTVETAGASGEVASEQPKKRTSSKRANRFNSKSSGRADRHLRIDTAIKVWPITGDGSKGGLCRALLQSKPLCVH
jgi:hypothetical protein